MAQQFDTAFRALLAGDAGPMLVLLGLSADLPARPLTGELLAALRADVVLLVEGPSPWVLHVEIQADSDPTMSARLLRYNAFLHLHYRLAVRSVLILLRPAADHSNLTGELRLELPARGVYLRFGYDIVRVWRLQVAALLTGELGLLPLAPVSDVGDVPVVQVLQTITERVDAEAEPGRARDIWQLTLTLLELKFSAAEAENLLREVRAKTESKSLLAVLQEGRAEGRAEGELAGLREAVIRLGTDRLGAIDPATQSALEAIADRDRLLGLVSRAVRVGSSAELLAAPEANGRHGHPGSV